MTTPAHNQPSAREQGKERLERHLAYAGLASRREAKALILSGLVTVNGKVIREPGFGIIPTDTVELSNTTEKESVLFYKPRGIETSKTSPLSKDIHATAPKFAHLSPIGRLDKDSEGLIILSNDGTLASALTKQGSNVPKIYTVTVRENVTERALQQMRAGIMLDGVPTKPALVEKHDTHTFVITLREGRKHQIRRMCDACKLTIENLVRTGIGHLTIGQMRAGNAKHLTPEDVIKLKA